jgi:proline-rich protein PRCC
MLAFQVKIASLSYDPRTGESATTFNPSKVQKRKHQINSLAVSAAERELELMEARGNSMKTKSQTQAKYGW